MPVKEINPIKNKLMMIITSGLRTREEICVASKIPYPTLMNSLLRDTSSRGVRLALYGAKLITEKELRDYDIWLAKIKEAKRKSPGKNATPTASKNKNSKSKK